MRCLLLWFRHFTLFSSWESSWHTKRKDWIHREVLIPPNGEVRKRVKMKTGEWAAALLVFCGKTTIWGVPWMQCHRKWEMPAVLDVLGGWVGFFSLFKFLMKLSSLFLRVFVVSVWGRNCSSILCKWYADLCLIDVFVDDWGSNYRESIFV